MMDLMMAQNVINFTFSTVYCAQLQRVVNYKCREESKNTKRKRIEIISIEIVIVA